MKIHPDLLCVLDFHLPPLPPNLVLCPRQWRLLPGHDHRHGPHHEHVHGGAVWRHRHGETNTFLPNTFSTAGVRLSRSPCTFKKWLSALKPAAVCWRWLGPEVWQEVAIAKRNLFALAPSRLSCPCHHRKHRYVQTHTYTSIGEWLAAYNQRDWMQELGPSKGRVEVSQSFNHTLPATSPRWVFRNRGGGG